MVLKFNIFQANSNVFQQTNIFSKKPGTINSKWNHSFYSFRLNIEFFCKNNKSAGRFAICEDFWRLN